MGHCLLLRQRAISDSGHQWVTQNMSGSLNSENVMFGIVTFVWYSAWSLVSSFQTWDELHQLSLSFFAPISNSQTHNSSCPLIFSKEGSKIAAKQKPTKLEQCMLSRLCSHCHTQLKVVESAFDFLSILCSGPFTLLRQNTTDCVASNNRSTPQSSVHWGFQVQDADSVSIYGEAWLLWKKKSQEKKHACPLVSLLWGH